MVYTNLQTLAASPKDHVGCDTKEMAQKGIGQVDMPIQVFCPDVALAGSMYVLSALELLGLHCKRGSHKE